jgi:hypothetical protein
VGDNVGHLSNPRLIIRSHLRFTAKYNLQLIPREVLKRIGTHAEQVRLRA